MQEYRLAFLVVVSVGILTGVYFFHLYRAAAPTAEPKRRRIDRWSFTPLDLGGFSHRSLILVSILGLFLELLLIRWISSEIRIFAYFKNFVLVACFLGFGLGCHLSKRRIHLLPTVVPLVLFCLLIKLPWPELRGLVRGLPLFLGAFSEVHIWGVPALDLSASALVPFLAALLFSVVLFTLLALVFIPVGQLIGWYIENAPNGIFGYSVNVLASLAGILLFTLICFLYQPPVAWFAVAGAMLVVLVWKLPALRWTALVASLVCLGLVSLPEDPSSTVHWSPYQKLSLRPVEQEGELLSYSLETNNSWYQQIIDLSPQFVAEHEYLLQGVPLEWNAYNLPYRFYPDPPEVLVLGAGMGNDAAAALRNGSGRVVAVEIDPLIVKLGRELHFEKPYESPRVDVVVDDARSYIQNSREQFDLIVFSLLDSHTNSSHFSNIRIDNYVYTVEALEQARRLLRPGGLFIVKFQVHAPWIAVRLETLLTEVFGYAPLQLQAQASYTSSGRFFFTGSRERIVQALAGEPQLAAYVDARSVVEAGTATLTTDDWPYFYQHAPGLPAGVIVISVVLVLLCRAAVAGIGLGRGTIRWHFFFLGAAFLLLEAQLVSKMALLFGTTWIVNSVVISGVLLLIFGANVLVEKVPGIPIRLAYGGLVASILVSYALPLEWFFLESIWLRGTAAVLVLCLPVFFAGIVFIKSFAGAEFSGEALGSNLIGALVGGMVESISLWTGLRSLLLVAALLYVASYLFLQERSARRERPAHV
ncbi:MAG: methyltransferase domain-containing protein [bacterium]|nr:methyltransferase domain-containing protein [bacterium]